jgi:hypothetical protein
MITVCGLESQVVRMAGLRQRGYVMFYKAQSLRKSLPILLFLFIFSQITLPGAALSKESAEPAKDRVLFMIAEKNIEQTHFYYWWSTSFWGSSRGKTEYKAEVVDISSASTALAGAFIKGGFVVVDPAAIKGEVEIVDAYRVEDLTVNNTTGFGKVMGADIVVKGRAVARAGIKTPDSNLGVYMADVTGQAIRVSDGRVLASAMGHGVVRHMSETAGAIEALRRAGEDLATQLIEQMGTE